MKEIESPNFYAVIPANVRYADIPANAKLLYGEITALASREGFCWASDKYFSELYKVSAQSISNWISILRKAGFIRNELSSSERGTLRKIFIVEAGGVYKKNMGGSIRKVIDGSIRKLGTSITRESITSNKIPAEQAPQEKEIASVLKLFEPVNPTIGRYYGNTTQRAAVERMLKTFGFEKLAAMVKALPLVNAKKYWPKSTTPVQLENNISIYKAKSDEEKSQRSAFSEKVAIHK